MSLTFALVALQDSYPLTLSDSNLSGKPLEGEEGRGKLRKLRTPSLKVSKGEKENI